VIRILVPLAAVVTLLALAGVAALLVGHQEPESDMDDADLWTIDDARVDFEERMHVVGVHAHDDGHTVTRRTLRMDWLSLECSSGRHHLCRPDRSECFCLCGHGGYDEAVVA